MKRVTGLGGVFIKTNDPKKMAAWYDQHLGLDFGTNSYMSFMWKQAGEPAQEGRTVFSFFPHSTEYFKPSQAGVMLNFRVENLEQLLQQLKQEGVEAVGEMETYEYGKFGWILDPDGNKIELWEPVDSGFGDQ